MIGIHLDKIKAIQQIYNTEINTQQSKGLAKLKLIDTTRFDANEKQYLQDVIKLFSQNGFLIQTPNLIENTIKSLGKIPASSIKAPFKPLKKHIIESLDYKGLRSTFYPKYFERLGVKACVYCNSHLTITINKRGNEYVSRFDVDHYHSKDDYPAFCISLFNLYPSCSSCNRLKGIKKVSFNLYTSLHSELQNSNFSFSLDPLVKAKYLTSKDKDDITFKFIEPATTTPDARQFQEVFLIKEIYETQKDIIEELIVKSQIYNPTYREQLRSNFLKLSLNEKLFERIIVGNFTDDKEIHKRPMSKIMMDIAKNLGIIKGK